MLLTRNAQTLRKETWSSSSAKEEEQDRKEKKKIWRAKAGKQLSVARSSQIKPTILHLVLARLLQRGNTDALGKPRAVGPQMIPKLSGCDT
jgi:hypothetical protein